MCGITAILSKRHFSSKILQEMTDSLSHRGPDGYGYMLHSAITGRSLWFNQDIENNYPHQNIGFGHRRLAIIDLSDDGLQPMCDESNRFCITYNGEIYNFLELKQELQQAGYQFRTKTDTEVILAAYRHWGYDCVKRFNGMWAFIIHDREKQEVFISRDRFGIKPLYYTFTDSSLYLASEIKALLKIPECTICPNEEVVARYLLLGSVDVSNETFFEGIFRFPSGTSSVIDLTNIGGSLTFQSYWMFPEISGTRTEDEIVQTFREVFQNALISHVISDVPVGSCLSGGLDSSSIVCQTIINQRDDKEPAGSYHCFSYIPNDERQSEQPFVECLTHAFPVRLHLVKPSLESVIREIPEIIMVQDEPFGSASQVAQWFVFREAAKSGIPVLLDGQGADELLGGYLPYLVIYAKELIRAGRWVELFRMVFLFAISGRQMTRGVHDNAYSDWFSFYRWVFSLLSRQMRSFIQCRLQKERRYQPPGPFSPYLMKYAEGISTKDRDATHQQDLAGQLKYDICHGRLPALLRYEDRNAMAHSIESRVPFLDRFFVDFVATLPSSMKMKNGISKYVLREAMKGVLPDQIRNRRDKIGFRADSALVFNLVESDPSYYIRNDNEYEERWFDEDGIKQLLESKSVTGTDSLLWRVVNLKLWVRAICKKDRYHQDEECSLSPISVHSHNS